MTISVRVKSNYDDMNLGIGFLKGIFISVVLSTLIIGTCILPVMAQGGVTRGYTIQITFFYPCMCTLTNMRVIVSDQTGKTVATSTSPDGSMLLVTFRTETPPSTYWLILNASGDASFSYYRPWPVHGSSFVAVQMIGGYYYSTIYLTR
jgi:hypothetical protein